MPPNLVNFIILCRYFGWSTSLSQEVYQTLDRQLHIVLVKRQVRSDKILNINFIYKFPNKANAEQVKHG
jgi:tRNA1(Val) A37 N6-methylase TrmN6